MIITRNEQLVTFLVASTCSEKDIREGIENIAKGEAFKVLRVDQVIQGKIDSEVKHTIVLSTSFRDDGEEGYTIDSFSYKDSIAGKELSAEALSFLEKNSIATMVATEEPRFDRYGTPDYASNENLAINMVNQQLGFVVSNDESFQVEVEDRGDDGCTTTTVTLEMSDIDAEKLAQLIEQ
jgi:hypothetical protein